MDFIITICLMVWFGHALARTVRRIWSGEAQQEVLRAWGYDQQNVEESTQQDEPKGNGRRRRRQPDLRLVPNEPDVLPPDLKLDDLDDIEDNPYVKGSR